MIFSVHISYHELFEYNTIQFEIGKQHANNCFQIRYALFFLNGNGHYIESDVETK